MTSSKTPSVLNRRTLPLDLDPADALMSYGRLAVASVVVPLLGVGLFAALYVAATRAPAPVLIALSGCVLTAILLVGVRLVRPAPAAQDPDKTTVRPRGRHPDNAHVASPDERIQLLLTTLASGALLSAQDQVAVFAQQTLERLAEHPRDATAVRSLARIAVIEGEFDSAREWLRLADLIAEDPSIPRVAAPISPTRDG